MLDNAQTAWLLASVENDLDLAETVGMEVHDQHGVLAKSDAIAFLVSIRNELRAMLGIPSRPEFTIESEDVE